MSTLFGLNKPNTNLRKNVFDLSEKRLFSSSAGMLLPCMVKECNPGEKFQINMAGITRTQPLNTSAFVRSREYYHFFFVPFKQLWSGWDNFINGVNYRTSSLQKTDDSSYSSVPCMSFSDYILKMLKGKAFCGLPEFDKTKKKKGYNRNLRSASAPESSAPLSALGPTVIYPSESSFVEGPSRSTASADRSYRPSTDGYNSRYIQDEIGKISADYLKTAFDEHGYLYTSGVSRLMDLLGYGLNFKGCSSLSEFVDKHYQLSSSFLSSLGSLSTTRFDGSSLSVRFNMFRFLAYQKIYNDFYKRDDYEKTNPLAWNIDDLSSLSDFDKLDYSRLLEMTRLRYRWSPKDYFSGVVPSELYGLDNFVNSLGSINGNSSVSSFDVDTYNTNEGVNITDPRDLSTKAIRTAFAIEKLMRLTRRAGGFDYISQTAAHYGFEPPKGRGDKVEFIGGFSNNIDISEVITQSSFAGELDGQSFGNGVGQIFGKGFGVSNNNKEIVFTAKEHGLIMCIRSVVPDLDYSAEGIDRFNTKSSRGDYFHPEFQDLGLQPVFGYELYNNFDSFNDVLGYVPMYSEYKISFDKLHGEFRNGRSMSAWSAGSLLSGHPVVSSRGLNISSLKINPKCLDRIFSVDFNGTEETDQFMTSVQFIVKAIRPMSVTGQNL